MSRDTTGDPNFENFWELYPNKKPSKAAVYVCWKRALTGGSKGKHKPATAREIIHGMAAYEFSSDPAFQPHASTWLNQRRWEVEQNTTPITVQTKQERGGWMDQFDRRPIFQPTRSVPPDQSLFPFIEGSLGDD